ncbi:phage tail protein [Pseudomonas putida]|uniref:phage tail-collar fiber domain-containing protein n=1 Tax=Pseudomonas putida TaxID=303 RepID=UPI00159D723B|nr:phage tail protein [Pseudomonas putida]NVN63857.1 phage tail protein [Pseudomonas putida]NVN68583.1 phage tail protein [Pseudomonas putida]
MGASITRAGQSLMAQKQAAQQVLNVDRFVFANVPGLDPTAPVDRSAGKPPAAQVVYTTAVDRAGYVNPNQVIYSVVVDSSVGDWDFNWIGLETEENVLLAVAYVPLQQKRKNIPPLQIGNNLTRNFLVEYDGAQELTGITVDANTWQHDFTARLASIDSRERLSNLDVYGRTCFLGDSLKMELSFGLYQLKAGVAYIGGIRLELAEPVKVQLPALPAQAWLDVTLRRQGSDVSAQWSVVFGSDKVDYLDGTGNQHYLVELANVSGIGDITDMRLWHPINGALVEHFAARIGDYQYLRARATTKDDVGLGNLPNAKSDDPNSDSSEILATTKALKAAIAQLEDNDVGKVVFYDLDAPPPRYMRANGAAVSRTVYSRLFAKIGTRHGAGDGVTTFNLPDVRGLFIRALDDGRNLDPGRVLGSIQADEIRSHSHGASSAGAGGHTHSASTAEAGNHAHQVRSGTSTPDGVDTAGEITEPRNIINYGEAGVHDKLTSESGTHSHPVTVLAVGDHTHPITVNATGGSETRPQNIAFNAFIKY